LVTRGCLNMHANRLTALSIAFAVMVLMVLPSFSVITAHADDTEMSLGFRPMNTDPSIRITSDGELQTQAASSGWTGSGTKGDPYVITGMDINGSGVGYCILVMDTDLHLTIRDNDLNNASQNLSDPKPVGGIILNR
jgi:hypothetical protein